MFRNLKEADRVGLFLIFIGVLITGASTLCGLLILVHPGIHELSEAIVDRGLSLLKDFFGVGITMIGAAYLSLRLQPKQPETPAGGESK